MNKKPGETFDLELTEEELDVICAVLDSTLDRLISNDETEEAEKCAELLKKFLDN